MKTLAIRTDQAESYIAYLENGQVKKEKKWLAHRQLSDTILTTIDELVDDVKAIEALIVYKGPGSFTGLRIGISVANTLAYSMSIPIVSTSGDEWIEEGLKRLNNSEDEKIAAAEYGGEANITKPKK